MCICTNVALANTVTPKFDDYHVDEYKGIRHLIVQNQGDVFLPNTEHTEGYPITFAGEYVEVPTPCGTECSSSSTINIKTGLLLNDDAITEDTSISKCTNGGSVFTKYHANSRLMIVRGALKQKDSDGSPKIISKGRCVIHYYLEDGGTLRKIK